MSRALALLLAAAAAQAPQTPQTAVDELLAADRQFAAAASKLGAVAAIAAMFADDVAMLPVPREGFARGKAKAIEALEADADIAQSSGANWIPLRGGISADGQHGFTFGFLWLAKPTERDEKVAVKTAFLVPFKYISYWVKQKEGWRVVVFKRRASGQPAYSVLSPGMWPPAVPPHLVRPSTEASMIARHRDSLDAAERAFSDEAQRIGLGPAFAKFGSDDAVNMGPPTGGQFVLGADAIGRFVGANAPPTGSHLSWAPDHVIVASSGDLGVTIGTIRRNTPPAAGQPATFPFITVWRRATPSDPWRYVAE